MKRYLTKIDNHFLANNARTLSVDSYSKNNSAEFKSKIEKISQFDIDLEKQPTIHCNWHMLPLKN